MKVKVYIELSDSYSEEELNKRGIQVNQIQELFTEAFQNILDNVATLETKTYLQVTVTDNTKETT
jgi:hypothetical protein